MGCHRGAEEWGWCRLERGGVSEVFQPHQQRSRRHQGSIDDNANFLGFARGMGEILLETLWSVLLIFDDKCNCFLVAVLAECEGDLSRQEEEMEETGSGASFGNLFDQIWRSIPCVPRLPVVEKCYDGIERGSCLSGLFVAREKQRQLPRTFGPKVHAARVSSSTAAPRPGVLSTWRPTLAVGARPASTRRRTIRNTWIT